MDLAKNPHFAKTYMVLNARNTGFGEEFKTAKRKCCCAKLNDFNI